MKFTPMCVDGRKRNCLTWAFGYCEECIDNEKTKANKSKEKGDA